MFAISVHFVFSELNDRRVPHGRHLSRVC